MKLCLQNCHIIRGISFEANGNVSRSLGTFTEKKNTWWTSPTKNDILAEAFSDKNNPPLLMYPGENSEDITYYSPSNNPNITKKTLIIIDGTWVEAKKILRRSPSLIEQSKLVQFSDSIESLITPIRRGNTNSFMSTLEVFIAVHYYCSKLTSIYILTGYCVCYSDFGRRSY